MPSTSAKQKRFFGVVRAIQKGDMKRADAGRDADSAASEMSVKQVRDFARSSRDNLSRIKSRSRK